MGRMLKPQLNTPDKKLLLQASSRAKMDEWISVMRKAVVCVSEHPKFHRPYHISGHVLVQFSIRQVTHCARRMALTTTVATA